MDDRITFANNPTICEVKQTCEHKETVGIKKLTVWPAVGSCSKIRLGLVPSFLLRQTFAPERAWWTPEAQRIS